MIGDRQMKKYKNNAAAASNYEKLDTNPDHYKSKFTKPYHPRNQSDGVVFHLMDGSTFKTTEYTVDDIREKLIDLPLLANTENHWLLLKNGGGVNLDRVIRFEPMRQEYKPRRRFS